MFAVVLIIHLMVALALVGVVLLQRSEGGALGMGGGGGGGFMTGRGAANVLTRTTAILAACFFATSIGLTFISSGHKGPKSILDQTPAGAIDSLPKSSVPAPAPLPLAPAQPSVPLPQ